MFVDRALGLPVRRAGCVSCRWLAAKLGQLTREDPGIVGLALRGYDGPAACKRWVDGASGWVNSIEGGKLSARGCHRAPKNVDVDGGGDRSHRTVVHAD